MKLIDLEIHNFRGIRNITIKPIGKNFLIYGPNGSGKSAVVDALDFLLTGQISRMKGKGCKDIKLKEHGPHIDYSTKDSCISAKVEIHGIDEPVEIKRKMDTPNKLICDDNLRELIKPVLELASRGQHVLTRREILNYVNADSSTRGKQIQTLLKITDVEKTRTKLLKVKNTLKNRYNSAHSSLNTISTVINSTIQINNFEEEKIIDYINSNRLFLNGTPIKELKSVYLKKGIEPQISSDINVNTQILENDINKVNKINLEGYKANIRQIDLELRTLKFKISTDHLLEKSHEHLKLTRLGLNLMDPETGCPLCDTPWETNDLKKHLKTKIEKLSDTANDLDKINDLSEDLIKEVNNLIASLNDIIKSTEILGLDKELKTLNFWVDELKIFLSVLEEESYPDTRFNSERVEVLLAPVDYLVTLDNIYSNAIEVSPEPSEEQTAWDNLTRLEENLKNYEISIEECSKSYEAYKKSIVLYDTFLVSRDSVLNKLYNDIKDRFVELYRQLHLDDEMNFDAEIVSEGAGVNFKVDFHGRGVNPPNALHSEGHQDSMGICLYLALAERLTQGFIDLIILDDVMMSVDAPHRREICNLLAKFFKGRQFFITTHDQTWARQLKTEGVINAKNMIEFSNWTIESGPLVNISGDMWTEIENALTRNDISTAAAKLRRGSEEYFSQVCESFQAPLRFRADGMYSLGSLLNAAMSEYKKQLKKAKQSAKKWDNNEEYYRLIKMEEHSKIVFERADKERWAINPAVHFNEYEDFTPQDFKPIIDIFQDLFSLFQCNKCGTFIHIVQNGSKAEAVKCKCGNVNWNL